MSQPCAFVAIYTGDTISGARLVAASADISLVRVVAEHLVQSAANARTTVEELLEVGRRQALQHILTETEESTRE